MIWSILIDLSVRGSLVGGLVWLLEHFLSGHLQAHSRRFWWMVAVLAFLVPLRFPILPALSPHTPPILAALAGPPRSNLATVENVTKEPSWQKKFLPLVQGVWLAGLGLSLGTVIFQTVRTGRRWAQERLCTEPSLLNLLEDCKVSASVTAPIGLVLSANVPAPAILGWLRPRILLPKDLPASLTDAELRAVLLHELAHFRAWDVPLHWLFFLVRAVHWFNPLAHLAARQWLRYRELAADEDALRWLRPAERPHYGEALVQALKHAHQFSTPYGALALGESIQNIKQRLIMITRHSTLARHSFAAFAVTLILSAFAVLQPVWADTASDAKTAATTATLAWVGEIDAGHYDKSWEMASSFFKTAITSEKWQGALRIVRTPLGRCISRHLTSSLYQTSVPKPDGTKLDGESIIAQYDSSFENLNAGRETITFMKEADGSWKASGYYIKPR